jgi:hypothetical protein
MLSIHSSQVLPSEGSKEFIIKATMYVKHLPAKSEVIQGEGGGEKTTPHTHTVKVQAVGSNDMVCITHANNWYW